jgi:hypothetical protein
MYLPFFSMAMATLAPLPDVPVSPEVGRGDPRVLPALREQLSKNDLSLVTVAAKSLARFGPKAKDAIPQLIECLNNSVAIHEDEFGELAAREYGPSIVIALGSIGPDAKVALPHVLTYFCIASINLPRWRQLTFPIVPGSGLATINLPHQ